LLLLLPRDRNFLKKPMIMAMVVRDRRVKIVVKGNVKEEEEEVYRVRGETCSCSNLNFDQTKDKH